jgi:hypothetical protein
VGRFHGLTGVNTDPVILQGNAGIPEQPAYQSAVIIMKAAPKTFPVIQYPVKGTNRVTLIEALEEFILLVLHVKVPGKRNHLKHTCLDILKSATGGTARRTFQPGLHLKIECFPVKFGIHSFHLFYYSQYVSHVVEDC